jgi:hypothetical protein
MWLLDKTDDVVNKYCHQYLYNYFNIIYLSWEILHCYTLQKPLRLWSNTICFSARVFLIFSIMCWLEHTYVGVNPMPAGGMFRLVPRGGQVRHSVDCRLFVYSSCALRSENTTWHKSATLENRYYSLRYVLNTTIVIFATANVGIHI